jgi:hypothetical protein
MIKEKFISYISKYLVAVALIMMLGLINEDRGLRGLPFAWLGPSGTNQVIVPRFIMSFVCVFIVVLAADILAKLIIRVREPSLKTLTKDVKTQEKAKASSVEMPAEDSIEIRSYTEPASEDAEVFEDIEEHSILQGEDVPEPKLKEILTKSTKKSKDSSDQGWGVILAVLAAVLSLAVPLIGIFDDGDSYEVFDDDQYFFATDEVIVHGTDKEEYIDHTKMALQELFENMVYENTPLGEFTNEEETQALFDLCVWEKMEIQLIEISVDEKKETSISRFVIADDYGNYYLAAVLMDIERTEAEDWDDEEDEEEAYIECETFVRGMAVLPGDEDTLKSEITDSGEGILTDEDIKDAVNLGEITYEGVNILLHRPDKGNLHLEAEENQAA